MNFNSSEFLLFYLAVLFIFYLVYCNIRLRNVFLLLASYAFYASWDWLYSGLLFGCTVINYFIGRGMEKASPRCRFWLLLVSLISSLSILGIFKYFNFFTNTSNEILNSFGLDTTLPYVKVLLPIGISFYTFQALSYTIDLYRNKIYVEKSFINFATFVSFFPQLVAGPIVRAADFLPQLRKDSYLEEYKIFSGLALTFRGLFKKIVIADMLAGFGVDAVFENPSSFSTPGLWLALYGYAIQIYCDFSGYSDIAIGVARTLGFEFKINFNRPYQSRTPGEFWRRWHISLSTWFRDYLYIPLGGSYGGNVRTFQNLLITMFLVGLWHGAAWNFVFWGIYHGLMLIVGRIYWPFAKSESIRSKFLGILFTFHMVCLGWLLFRVPNMETFMAYFTGLFSFQNGEMVTLPFIILLALGLGLHYIPQIKVAALQQRFVRLPVTAQALVYFILLLSYVGVTQQSPSFIYFQF